MFNKIRNFISNSVFFQNIDNIAFFILVAMLIVSVLFSSEIIGCFAIIFSVLIIFKKIITGNSLKLLNYEKTLIIFFLIVTLSLFGSTLFKLSLHGYLKTLIYIVFFFCVTDFYSANKNKITLTLLLITGLMSFESIIAILQNHAGVLEISGWQDMTNINPEEVISRAYGTLKPYNPNLLAGYLLCGLSSFVFFILKNLKEGKKRYSLIFAILFIINLIAIVDTGCRGAYLGFLFFFPPLIIALLYYTNKTLGGLSNIKKRYKNLFALGLVGFCAFILLNPALTKRIESIFAFRADSSISFRLNVYESAIRMFADNVFLGIGVGNQNFREIYGLYMKTGYDALGSYCVPLEIAVESGIFALISFIIFMVLVLKACSNLCLDKNNQSEIKILALCTALMILAVTGHGLFDTIWFRPQVQLLFWINIALIRPFIKIPQK